MRYMEACAEASGTFDGVVGGEETGLAVAYLGVQGGSLLRRALVFALGVGKVGLHHTLLLAVGYDELAGVAEEVVELFGVVDQHVSCRGAEEELDGGVASGLDSQKVVDVVVGGTEHESVVDCRIACREVLFAFQCLQGSGLWFGVGHVDHRGDAAGTCGAALAVEGAGGVLRLAAVAEVHVCVYYPRKEQQAPGIYYGCRGHAFGNGTKPWVGSLEHFGNAVALDEDRTNENAALVDDGRIINQCIQNGIVFAFIC